MPSRINFNDANAELPISTHPLFAKWGALFKELLPVPTEIGAARQVVIRCLLCKGNSPWTSTVDVAKHTETCHERGGSCQGIHRLECLNHGQDWHDSLSFLGVTGSPAHWHSEPDKTRASRYHIQKKHSQFWKQYLEQEPSERPSQPIRDSSQASTREIDSDNGSMIQWLTERPRNIDSPTLKLLLIQFLVLNNLPFRVTRSNSFRELLNYLSIGAANGLSNIGSDIDQLYDEELNKFKIQLQIHQQTQGVFCLCIDAWTSRTQHAFLGVTIHWIDSDWTIQNRVLQLIDLKKRHTGEYLAYSLNKLIESFKIQESIYTITMDNASVNKTIHTIVEKQQRKHSKRRFHGSIYCLAHILNLVVQALLKPFNTACTKKQLRQLIYEELEESDQSESENERETNSSSTVTIEELQQQSRSSATTTSSQTGLASLKGGKRQRTATLIGPKVSENSISQSGTESGLLTLIKVRKQVAILRQSQSCKLRLDIAIQQRRRQGGINIRKPTLDIPTRWNSTYYMLQNYLNLKYEIQTVISKELDKFTGFELTLQEYQLLSELLPLLQEFQKYSVTLQADEQSYLSDCLLILIRLQTVLSTATNEITIPELRIGVTKATQKLEKYFKSRPIREEDSRDLDSIWQYITATILDPRFKMQPFRIGQYWTIAEAVNIERRFELEYSRYSKLFKEVSSRHSQETLATQKSAINDLHEQYRATQVDNQQSELIHYLNSPTFTVQTSFQVLSFWKASTFKILPFMARDIWAVNPTSAAVERLFSKASDIANPPKRNRLTKRRINQLSCLKSWLSMKESQSEGVIEEELSDDTDYEEWNDSWRLIEDE